MLHNAQGEPIPVHAVVNSGASHSVVTRDTLRRLDLLGAVEESNIPTFLNADGNRGRAAGRIRGLQVSTGDMTTLLDPYVSNALNYQILLGTDFLYPIRASISYGSNRLEYDNDSDQRGSIPIHFLRGGGLAAYYTPANDPESEGEPET
ncbi:hypothetical protein GPECTOR_153g63 [Gonium pectorale]|uniref:Peptidase A2 domain-containing protein n=1 Tax=Gonium pectorale TaxID=33097 RepID=A0A150FZA5_GONPE|nr:hypothetical protein GPECTOR_153g63 [Gonium pectorale]|eukprot:KXZ42390.1 hypothetical protein GPECTOR_153g63 [Gonium pectorale]